MSRFPAESALVARLLLEPEQIAKVSSLVAPEDFFDPDARAAYDALIRLDKAGRPIDVFTVREAAGDDSLDIDVFSLTRAHRAPLEEYARIIRETTTQAENMEAESLGVVDLSLHRSPPPPPLLGVLSPEGTTVLYGEGGDGKGWIAARWASQLPMKVAILDFENHPTEWAYRLDKFNGGNVLYFNPKMTLDKWADERAARLFRQARIGFVIVDSATYASDIEDPYSPQPAMAYKFARERLGNPPCLLLAHTAKNSDGIYGSVFWRNEARIVWQLTRHGISRQRTLTCRKANAYGELNDIKLSIEFDENRGILNLHQQGKPWTPTTALPAGEF